jgi:hypothetical protein
MTLLILGRSILFELFDFNIILVLKRLVNINTCCWYCIVAFVQNYLLVSILIKVLCV